MHRDRIVVHGSAEDFPDTGYAAELANYGLRIANDERYNPDPDTMCPCIVVVKGMLETCPIVINYRTNEIEFGAGGSTNSWDIMLYGYWFRTPDGWKPFAVGQLLTSFKNVVTRFNEHYKIPFISGMAVVETNPPIDHYMSNTGNSFTALNRLPFGSNNYTGRTPNTTKLSDTNSNCFNNYTVTRHDTLGWTNYGSRPGTVTLAATSLYNTSWYSDIANGDTCLLGGSAGRSNSEELVILYTNNMDFCDYGTNKLAGDYPRYIRSKPLPNLQYDVDNRICEKKLPPLSFKDLAEWRFSGSTESDWTTNRIVIFHESLHGQTTDYTTMKNSGELDSNDELRRPYKTSSLIDGTSVNVRIANSMGDHNLIQSPTTVGGYNTVECEPIDIPLDSFWFLRYVRAFRAGTNISTANLTRVKAPIYTDYQEFINAGNVDKYYDTDRPGYVSVYNGNWVFKWLPVYDLPLNKCRLVKDGIYKGIDVAKVLKEYETSRNNRSMNTTYPPDVPLEVWIPNFDESQYEPYVKPSGKGKYAWLYITVEGVVYDSNDTRLKLNKDTLRFEELFNGSCTADLVDLNYNSLGKNINSTLDKVLHSNILESKKHSTLFYNLRGKPIADILIGTEGFDVATVSKLCPWYGDDELTTAFLDTVPEEYWSVTRTTGKAYMPDFLSKYTSQVNVNKNMSSIIPINNDTELKMNLIDNGTITTSVGHSTAPLHIIAWKLDPSDIKDDSYNPDAVVTPPSKPLSIGLTMYMSGKTLSDLDVPWNADKNCYYVDGGEYSFGVDTKTINVNGKDYNISVGLMSGALTSDLILTNNGATLRLGDGASAGSGFWSYTKTKKESTTFLIKWIDGEGVEKSLTIKDKDLNPSVEVDETLTDDSEIRKLLATAFPMTIEIEFGNMSKGIPVQAGTYGCITTICNPSVNGSPALECINGNLVEYTHIINNDSNAIYDYFPDLATIGNRHLDAYRTVATPNNKDFKIISTSRDIRLLDIVREHPKLKKANIDTFGYKRRKDLYIINFNWDFIKFDRSDTIILRLYRHITSSENNGLIKRSGLYEDYGEVIDWKIFPENPYEMFKEGDYFYKMVGDKTSLGEIKNDLYTSIPKKVAEKREKIKFRNKIVRYMRIATCILGSIVIIMILAWSGDITG